MFANNKRPIETEDFIDLTQSDDEEISRPTKRARSGSSRSTPSDLNLTTKHALARNASPQKPSKRDDRVGSTSSKSNSPPTNGIRKVKVSSHNSEQKTARALAPVVGPGQLTAHRAPKTLTNGFNKLSFRPSPSRQSPARKATSPDVVDLCAESDKDTSVKQQWKLKGPQKSHSPSTLANTLSLSDWVKTDVKPIRFDPTIKISAGPDVSLLAPVATNIADRLKTQTSSTSSLFVNLPQVTRINSSSSKSRSLANPPQIPQVPTVNVPPTEAQVLRRIKDDITYIRTNPREVEIGIGVARFNDTDLNAATFERARQKRRKGPVKRESLLLDLGKPAPSNKSVKDTSIIEPRNAVRHLLLERFKHSQDAPLSFKNRIDERCLDGKFQFVSKYICSRRVIKRKQTLLPSRICRCEPARLCQDICNCATVQAKEPGKELKEVHGIRPYERTAKGTIVLSQGLLQLSSLQAPVIYECTDRCSCGNSCTNKLVQKGRTLSLQIFETGRCGFGVKAMQDIAKGQFIDLYLGEVLTTAEIQKRESAVDEHTPSYIMSLDMFISDEKAAFHVDGANFGSLTRFVNHSCEPNAKTFPVVLSEDTRHIYHVAFFAVKDIAKGSEITIDYNPDLKDQPVGEVQPADETLDSAIVQCKCGSINCRKRLWMPGKEKRVRRRYLPDIDDD